MIIGVTGRSGVGKSTYSKKLAKELGYYYLDIDEIGHKLLDDPEIKKQIKEKFNIDVSSTDRKKLGELVFASRNNEMKQLADITWKKMQDVIDSYIEFEGNPGIILDWILLYHTKYFKMCDKKILVTLDEPERRKRVKARDNITDEELDLRDKASISYNIEDFDEVIFNK